MRKAAVRKRREDIATAGRLRLRTINRPQSQQLAWQYGGSLNQGLPDISAAPLLALPRPDRLGLCMK